jgi:hypothetical protein
MRAVTNPRASPGHCDTPALSEPATTRVLPCRIRQLRAVADGAASQDRKVVDEMSGINQNR